MDADACKWTPVSLHYSWLAILKLRTGADLVVANVDKNLTVFLKKYFPKETKAKQQDNDVAASIEMYGEDFANVKCLVM